MTGNRSFFVLLAACSALTVGSGGAQASPTSAGPGVAASNAGQLTRQNESKSDVRRRAEDLAGAASERFSEILSEQEGEKPIQVGGADASREREQRSDKLTLIPVWDWLARASRDYENVIIAKLKNPSGEVEIETPPNRVLAQGEVPSTPLAQDAPPPQLGWGSIIDTIREWLARANRSYRNEIVKNLVRPRDGKDPWKAVVRADGESGPSLSAQESGAPTEVVAETDQRALPAPAAEKPATPKAVAPATVIAEPDKKAIALKDTAEIAPKLQAEEVKRLAEEAEAKRKAAIVTETKRLTDKVQAKRLAEESATEREAARVAEAKRRDAIAAETRRLTDEVQAKRLAEEAAAEREAARVAEAKQLAEEAEAKRLAEEAEAKRKADEAAEAQRLAEEAEAEREAARKEEAKRLAEEAAAKRLAEEAETRLRAAKKAEAKRLADEVEARRLAEEAEAKRKAAIAAETKRLTDEALATRLAEEAAAEREAARVAEAKQLAEEAEAKRKAAIEADATPLDNEAAPKRVAESVPAPQIDGQQTPSDTDKTVTPPVPVAKVPSSSVPTNDRSPVVGAEKRIAAPSRPKAKRKKVRVRKARLRKKRVRKSRYSRRRARGRSGARVYAYTSGRKRAGVSRHRKQRWERGAKHVSPRKIHRKRARVHGYRKRHRVSGHSRSNMYVVRRGDTLWGIAKRHYGKGSSYRRIYRANRHKIRNPNRIYPRQRLYIPSRRR